MCTHPVDIYCCFVFDLIWKLRSSLASKPKRQVNAFLIYIYVRTHISEWKRLQIYVFYMTHRVIVLIFL